MSELTEKTLFILGAGASVENGRCLTKDILKVGYYMYKDLQKRQSEWHRRQPEGLRIITLNDWLNGLLGEEATFREVYDFIVKFFQSKDFMQYKELDVDNLPSINVVLGILELATRRKSNIGTQFDCTMPPYHVKRELMKLMYYVLQCCNVRYTENKIDKIDYSHQKDNLYSKFIEKIGNSTIVTLNYDLGIDDAINESNKKLNYGIQILDSPFYTQDRKIPKNEEEILLLKMHGSFNWRFCPSCNTLWNYDYQQIPCEKPNEPTLGKGDCRNCGDFTESIIIPPSLVKSYENIHVQQLWLRASEELRKAEKIVFIGYSMDDADIEFQYLVKQSTSLNNKLKSIIVIKPEDFSAYRRFFGKDSIEEYPQTFSKFIDEMNL